MAVLDLLARAANSVVTRQEIFDSVWPGAAISDEALTQRVADLRKAFGDSARHPKVIETIPKVGFRLIPPVKPLSEDPPNGQEVHDVPTSENAIRWIVAVAVGLLAVALSLSLLRSVDTAREQSPPSAESPVIAVLPFVNMSGDPEDEYLSDGISEELINLLAEVPGLGAISRTSSFSFKGERLKVPEIARELNASLIVEGTVRRAGKRVRITAQLIDPGTDKHLWSESYDRELSDIFMLQQEIAQSIVTALQDQIGAHTVTGSRLTDDIEAYELFLAGRHYFYQRGAALDKAILLLQMAVDKDPAFAEAWAYLAAAAVVTCYYETSIANEDAWLIAEQAAGKSLELDPEMGLALATKAMLAYLYGGDLALGFELIDRAADDHPQDITIRFWAGMHYWYCGYLEGALSHFLYAHTHDPLVGITNANLGLLYLALGREDLAAPRLAKATELGYPNHHHTQASLLMRRGDVDAAFSKLRISLADPKADPDRLAWNDELEEAGRSFVESPASAGALISVIERAPKGGATEKARLALLFDLKDPFFEYLSRSIDEGPLWLPYLVPTLWLPEYRDYVEDPRFLEISRKDGALEVWERRGFLDGCSRVTDVAGDHLDCAQRYR
jgi:TolB-like protein/DNA-binding winged helix-turn-helix (wHTH) protein